MSRQFAEDQHAFFTRHQSTIAKYDLLFLSGLASARIANARTTASDPMEQLLADMAVLLRKWDIFALADRDLPVPHGFIQQPPPDAPIDPQHADPSGSRGPFGDLMMLPKPGGAHMRKWYEAVAPESASKREIPTLARCFVVHHFWKALFARHREAIKGRRAHLREAFAEYLQVYPEHQPRALAPNAISGDALERKVLRLIAKHRGPNWEM